MKAPLFAAALAVAIGGCGRSKVEGAATPASSQAAAPAAKQGPIVFAEDDLGGATERAKREKKALFVDVWAPWCHTCLSMKNFVLSDPALATLSDRVVFLALDFDKEANAAFFEKHEVKNLPTYLVVDPSDGDVKGAWIGSGSAKEIRDTIEQALAAMTGNGSEAAKAFARGRALEAKDPAAAAKEYEIAFEHSNDAWPLRSEAGLAWITALSEAKEAGACVDSGRKILPQIQGAAIPSDLSIQLLDCAGTNGDEASANAKYAAITRLREFIAHPPEGATVDDRADACSSLAQALEANGDKSGAKDVREQWLALVDDAARSAPSPEIAHTFDYERANAMVALGRGEEAAKMLEERQKQMPDAYEPPARLTRVYMALNRWSDAEKSVDRALKLLYGPRKLLYLGVKAQIEEKLGKKDEALAALRAVVSGYEKLPPGQAAPKQLEEAKKKLAEGEKRLAGSKP